MMKIYGRNLLDRERMIRRDGDAVSPSNALVGEEVQKLLNEIIVMDTRICGTTSEDAYEVEGLTAHKARRVLALLSREKSEHDALQTGEKP